MFFVGIDIGKNNHVASMMNESGKVVFKAFSFPNTSDGGNSLFSKLSSYSSSTSDFEIGMEATGSLFTLFFLKRAFFSMSSIRFRLTAGAEAQKSANAKTISSILF